MQLARPVRFPPDTRAETGRVLAMISRSSWLSIAIVAIVLSVAVWLLLRGRRAVAKQTSMQFLLNSVVVITVLLFVVLALAAVEILVEPAAALQTFYGVWCLPPPRATVAIFLAVCLLVAVGEAVTAKSTGG
jgi:hypothetical protein